jgi:hypothetical protein
MTRSGIGVGATLTPPAQLWLCSRFAALLIKGRDGVCRAATRFIASRVIARGACQTSPLQRRGDGAAKSANLWFRELSQDHGGPLGANRGGYGTGPCFSRLRPR